MAAAVLSYTISAIKPEGRRKLRRTKWPRTVLRGDALGRGAASLHLDADLEEIVVRFLAGGDGRPVAGEERGAAEDGVDALCRLGVTNRAEAVALALRKQMLKA